jgi:hypothetical protein
MKKFLIFLIICAGGIDGSFAQTADTAKHNKENTVHTYFIITAGTEINAFYNDKPISATSISEFNDYVQHNNKILKDSWVVVTGKPKSGTFDEVLRTLSRYHIRHVEKNILKD